LPYKTAGKMRYIPPDNWTLGDTLPHGTLNGREGILDKFGNVWHKGSPRTRGEAWEWDVQLSKNATAGWKYVASETTGKGYINISWEGNCTH
jgi:hypothetical protein